VKLHILISVNKGRQFLPCLMVAQEKHFINLLLAEIRQKIIIYIYNFFTRYCCSCRGDVFMLYLLFTAVAIDVLNNRTAVLVDMPSKYFTIVQVHCLVVSLLCHLRQHVKLWAAHCKIYEEIKYGRSHCCTWRFLTKSSCHSKKT
jgi:hypothetical protein